jgi:asparagine synthase (glutamine-hydrolysing)
VSFSGGRDSSAVLAVAVAAARRSGVDDPIPITLRFPSVPSTDETGWQERVIGHLGVRTWEIVEIGDELDLLGPIAQNVLERHGLLWPPNAYFHQPMFERAAGGTFLTGLDGDGLFGGWRWRRAQAVLHRRVAVEPRDLGRVGLALAPAPVRRRGPVVGHAPMAPWLRRAAQRELTALVRDRMAAEPRRWDRRVEWYRHHRYLHVSAHSLACLATDHEVTMLHPLLDADFLAALGRVGGSAGFADRTAAMRAVFAADLPEDVLARSTKGEFGRALWRGEARAFAERWDGTGLDLELIDAAALRDMWLAENPLFGSMLPLHQAWLESQT